MFLKEYLITLISFIKNASKRNSIKLATSLFNKEGLEIGGPSKVFGIKSFFPAYLFAKSVDGVNYSSQTVWEGSIAKGTYKYYNKHKGVQYISEATDLSDIPNLKYDFLLSSHCLEHVANPLKALKEWNRVLKPKGMLVLILPDKNFTFDKKRPYTSFDHLVADYDLRIDEHDDNHFDEVNSLHDIQQDIIGNRDNLLERTKNNYVNRCVHHHVFNFPLITQMLSFCGFDVTYQASIKPFHLLTVAYKKEN